MILHEAGQCGHSECVAHAEVVRRGKDPDNTHNLNLKCPLSYQHDVVPLGAAMGGSILEEAKGLVRGARQRDYDKPSVNFTRIAKMWSVILGREITPREFTLCMLALKIAREVGTPKRDNWVDMAGYIEAYDWAVEDLGSE